MLPVAPAGTLVAQEGAAEPACREPGVLAVHDLGSVRSELARALSITRRSPDKASGIFRSAVRRVPVCADSARFLPAWLDSSSAVISLAPLEALATHNSAFPRDRNNGVLWGGVGTNTQLQGGVELRWRWFSAAAIPRWVNHPNEDHRTLVASGPRSPFGNPFRGSVDLPKRFGDEPFSTIDPGQSFVAVEAGPVEARFSTENLWLGAAQTNPLLLSNTAGGFPHLRISTDPLDVYVGDLEVAVLWGSLSESEYFDGNPDNDSHLFTATSIVFEPRILEGLHLGIARVYHDTAGATGHSPGFYLSVLGEMPTWVGGGNRAGNAIGALYARWVHPESGFEVYTEWAKEDTPYNLEDLVREPDWTQAYMFGFQKVFVSPERLIRVYGEVIHLGESTPVRAGKGHFTFYTHGAVPQGHTHRGQLLGAGVGLGSDSRSLGLDWFDEASRWGVWLEHARYDEDTYYRAFAPRYGEARHNAELTAEGRYLRLFGSVETEVAVRASRQYDRDFITLVNLEPPLIETNWGLDLRLRWQPPRLY